MSSPGNVYYFLKNCTQLSHHNDTTHKRAGKVMQQSNMLQHNHTATVQGTEPQNHGTLSTYLSQEQSPQHFPRSVRFFSASFMSELIWSRPSSIRSSCSGQREGAGGGGGMEKREMEERVEGGVGDRGGERRK